ncbi:transmembrane protein 180 isoform X3 [Alexandromys fortis]|uniref:transmembrane protein 180 isoform X3 n=1 Tax=Alexandromys fortis TaxID=100897 RepID=UPI0021532BCF|nr:transmembrane protein 180 isoform X3 [Microtus fortis]
MRLDWPQAWLLGLPVAVVYGSLALFTSVLHNVFLLYYVDTFVSVYKINKLSFWIGETVFLLWNSFNDPLFGWLSDHKFLSSQPRSGAGLSSRDVVLTRVRALSWHGPLLALSFLAFWVPWAPAGLQFLLCLCLYDGFLTLVDLHHHALLADLALSAHDRTHLNFYCSLFSAAGSMSVFASYAFWNKEDLSSFRAFCVVLAAGSGLGFLGATQLLRRRIETTRRDRGYSAMVVDSGVCEEEPLVGGEEAGITLGQYLRQLARHQNFLWFVGMDLVQASPMLLLISTTSTSCPCAGAGVSTPWCGASSCSSWALASSCCWLARTAPACFASSLPGHDLFQQSPVIVGSVQPRPEPPAPAPAQAATLRQGCFYLLVLVPITCALLQLFTWSQFTLHGRRLRMVKAQRQNLAQIRTLDIKMV